MMSKYRKKPVVIKAIQWLGDNWEEVTEELGLEVVGQDLIGLSDNTKLSIPTLEGVMEASVGDYIIRGVQGEFYPCKPDIFETTYEKVE